MINWGQVAYEGYFAYSKGKSLISGADLPTWDNQAEPIKKAWEEAAKSVLDTYSRIKETR